VKRRAESQDGVSVVRIRAEDLSLERILELVSEDLPLCIVDTEGIYYRVVAAACADYMEHCLKLEAMAAAEKSC
jgi:hypothetical protein